MTKVRFTRSNVDDYLGSGKIGQFNHWPHYLAGSKNYLFIKKNPNSMSQETEFLLKDYQRDGAVYAHSFSFVKSYCLGFHI